LGCSRTTWVGVRNSVQVNHTLLFKLHQQIGDAVFAKQE